MSKSGAFGGIQVYAELLSNLRQLSIVATLPSASNGTTTASLSQDAAVITVEHEGERQQLTLPEKPRAGPLMIPSQAAAILSWRLPLPSSGPSPPRFSLEDQPLPWSAIDLKPGAPVLCRGCRGIIVAKDSITVWKDLPSENWAEMMEFWHCHKPHDNKQPQDTSATTKGYGANNTISPQKGVGLVDIGSLLVSPADCQINISTNATEIPPNIDDLAIHSAGPTRFLQVYCRTCSKAIGIHNVATSSTSLFKWQLICGTNPSVAGESQPDVDHCLAAILMSTISRSGSSKAIIAPHHFTNDASTGKEDAKSLYVWVLNPNVIYSSSSDEKGLVGTALKVLYKSVTVQEGNDIVDAMDSDVQEITLPPAAIEKVLSSANSSNTLLPQAERCFKEWQVGLLHRW